MARNAVLVWTLTRRSQRHTINVKPTVGQKILFGGKRRRSTSQIEVMGDHYLPQYYLKGFSQRSGKQIWAYDKQDSRKFQAQVKNVATETGFYSPEAEQYLANNIEGPANAILGKIRDRGQVTPDDKKVLAEYMVVMMKRVPQGRERVKKLAPVTADRLFEKISQQLSITTFMSPEEANLIRQRRSEIREFLDRYSQEVPKKIWLDNIPPQTTPRIVEAIRRMTWLLLTFDEKPAFMTCDNPVFYFTCIGIGKRESEITFPISSHVTLWATWRADLAEGYFSTTKQVAKEINRRTASNAGRYVFHCDDEGWVLPFVTKGRWQLHRLQ